MRDFLLYSVDPTDSTSWYRSIGPFSQLWRQGWKMVRCPPQINWAVVSGPEVGVIQRPFAPEHVRMAKIIKRQMPLCLEFDDLFYDIPMSNPAYGVFSQSAIQESLDELLDLADMVIVSTTHLAKQISQKTKQVRVVANAYNDFLLPKCPPKEPRTRTVSWRGSETHVQDLLSVADGIVEVARAYQDWKFVFIGSPPFMLNGRMEAQWVSTLGIFEFHELIRDQLKPAVCMVPLDDNSFNRSKSDCVWLEVTMAGGITMLPDFLGPPATQAMHYTGPENFAERLSATLDLFSGDLSRSTEISRAAFEEVKKNRFLSRVNLQRASILTEMTK